MFILAEVNLIKRHLKKDRPGCINKHGNCKARFPRTLFTQMEVDSKNDKLSQLSQY
jgi:hypothetical protein